MFRVFLAVSVIIFAGCKKDNKITAPQQAISVYSADCNEICKPQMHRVDLNGNDYIGVLWISDAGCSDARVFYHKDGRVVDDLELSNKLRMEGNFKEVIWKCD